MMKKLMEEVKKLAEQELNMANEQYPLFVNGHEASAVIREELEEAETEMAAMKYAYQLLWDDVKDDEVIYEDADELNMKAVLCACECIQVAAMCKKARMSIYKDKCK